MRSTTALTLLASPILVAFGSCASVSELPVDVSTATSTDETPQGRRQRRREEQLEDPDPEPQRGPRRSSRRDDAGHPRLMSYWAFGGGRMDHKTGTPNALVNFDDRSSMFFTRGIFEGGSEHFGGGIQFEYTNADDLDSNVLGRDTDVDSMDFFMHLTIRPTAGRRFRMPLRLGPYVQSQRVEATNSINEYRYVHVGGRAELEAELDLARTARYGMSLYLSGNVGGGWGHVDVRTSSDDVEFDTQAVSYGVETGMRMQFGKFLLAFGYAHRKTTYEESDENTWVGTEPISFSPTAGLSGTMGETDFQRGAFFVGGGVRW